MELYGLSHLKPLAPKSVPMNRWAQKPVFPELFKNGASIVQKRALEVYGGTQARRILILAGDSVTQGWMTRKLRARKTSFVSVNLDKFIFGGAIEADLENAPKLRFQKQIVDLANITHVYAFMPQFMMGLRSHQEVLTGKEKIFVSRWSTAILDLQQLLPKAKWFPGPYDLQHEDSQQRFSDLKLAKELGIVVPQTILTSDPKRAKQFIQSNGGAVVFREFGVRRVQSKGVVTTFAIEPDRLEKLSSVKNSPCVFQEYVQKRCEYRAVYIDGKFFVCEIDSQSGALSKFDWRAYEYDKVKFSKSDLPKPILNKLAQLAKSRGLIAASFDLARNSKNQIVFFEMNRPGAWLFVEALTGLPITDAAIAWSKR